MGKLIISWATTPLSGGQIFLPTPKPITGTSIRGIDLVYYGNQGQLEYDFIVRPGVDPSIIQLTFQGVTPRLDEAGNLRLDSSNGEFFLRKPYIYQDIDGTRESITGGYVLTPLSQGKDISHVSFHIAAYDSRKPLIIDPILTYSSYLGGVNSDNRAGFNGNGITVDSSDNVYVTGGVASSITLPPGTTPAFGNYVANLDAFVAKFSPDGDLVYFTYLGGSLEDFGTDIAVDSFGRAYVTGETNSSNFPFQGANADNACGVDGSCGTPSERDAFVTWLNPTGTALVFSTFLGGGEYDVGRGIAVDTAGNVYVTGVTESTNFPGQNCFGEGTSAPGDGDAFVYKYDSTTATIYSCYLGGSQYDDSFGIAVDSTGNAYVTGLTVSDDFPTVNALQPDLNEDNGSGDAFVTKISPGPTPSLLYSTYLGGSGVDWAHAIDVTANGNAYVAGFTNSDDFPAMVPYGSSGDAFPTFVSQLTSSGDAFVYSTLFTASFITGIAVDTMGNAYVTGEAGDDFPTVNAFQPTPPGGGDGFVMKIGPGGSTSRYATYLGGSALDFGYAIAIDSVGSAYVAGVTDSENFPTTPDAFQSTFGGGQNEGGQDVFIAKITEAIRAAFEGPIAGAVAGVALVRGWAFDIFDGESISEVAFFINGIPNTTIPCCSARKDIQSAFPELPEANTLNNVSSG